MELGESTSTDRLNSKFRPAVGDWGHSPVDFPVEGRHVQSVNFAALGFDGIVDGAEAELFGAEVFGVAADGVFDHVAREAEVAGGGDASEGYVDVGVAGVGVGDGDPFEVGVQVL